MIKGMLAGIYRSGLVDCTNGGVTGRVTNAVDAVVFGRGLPELHVADGMHPILSIEHRVIGGREYLVARPVDPETWEPIPGGMFGGNFVWSCDSRFRAVAEYPIPVHDRFE